MSESKAVENYNAFDSIRNRFGGARKTSPDGLIGSHQPVKKTSAPTVKRRFDPRSSAPPLIPLVEESDLVQKELFVNSGQSSPVKGKWKHGNVTKVNGPDFDALETASVTSASSAYSSRSESSALSPLAGSMSELSDIGSADTHFEYDITTRAPTKQHTRTSSLRASFEKSRSFDQSDVRYTHDSGESTPDEVVCGRTKAWNRYIGEWNFDRVKKIISTSPVDSNSRVTNEVRLPTPSSTPVSGSMENLLATGSRSSLLSSNPDEESEEEQMWNWTQEIKPPLGKFLDPHHRRRPHSASSLTRQARKASGFESFSETDLTAWQEPVKEKPTSPLVLSSTDLRSAGQCEVPPQPKKETRSPTKKQEKTVKRLVRRVSEPVFSFSPAVKPDPVHNRSLTEDSIKPSAATSGAGKDKFKKLQKITPARSNKWLAAYQKYRDDKEKQGDTEPSEVQSKPQGIISTIEEEREDLSQEGEEVMVGAQEMKIGQRVTVKSKIWHDAYKKHRTIHSEQPAAASDKDLQSQVEETSVAQRAKVFGGMQRKPLKRSQSFQFSSHSNQI